MAGRQVAPRAWAALCFAALAITLVTVDATYVEDLSLLRGVPVPGLARTYLHQVSLPNLSNCTLVEFAEQGFEHQFYRIYNVTARFGSSSYGCSTKDIHLLPAISANDMHPVFKDIKDEPYAVSDGEKCAIAYMEYESDFKSANKYKPETLTDEQLYHVCAMETGGKLLGPTDYNITYGVFIKNKCSQDYDATVTFYVEQVDIESQGNPDDKYDDVAKKAENLEDWCKRLDALGDIEKLNTLSFFVMLALVVLIVLAVLMMAFPGAPIRRYLRYMYRRSKAQGGRGYSHLVTEPEGLDRWLIFQIGCAAVLWVFVLMDYPKVEIVPRFDKELTGVFNLQGPSFIESIFNGIEKIVHYLIVFAMSIITGCTAFGAMLPNFTFKGDPLGPFKKSIGVIFLVMMNLMFISQAIDVFLRWKWWTRHGHWEFLHVTCWFHTMWADIKVIKLLITGNSRIEWIRLPTREVKATATKNIVASKSPEGEPIKPAHLDDVEQTRHERARSMLYDMRDNVWEQPGFKYMSWFLIGIMCAIHISNVTFVNQMTTVARQAKCLDDIYECNEYLDKLINKTAEGMREAVTLSEDLLDGLEAQGANIVDDSFAEYLQTVDELCSTEIDNILPTGAGEALEFILNDETIMADAIAFREDQNVDYDVYDSIAISMDVQCAVTGEIYYIVDTVFSSGEVEGQWLMPSVLSTLDSCFFGLIQETHLACQTGNYTGTVVSSVFREMMEPVVEQIYVNATADATWPPRYTAWTDFAAVWCDPSFELSAEADTLRTVMDIEAQEPLLEHWERLACESLSIEDYAAVWASTGYDCGFDGALAAVDLTQALTTADWAAISEAQYALLASSDSPMSPMAQTYWVGMKKNVDFVFEVFDTLGYVIAGFEEMVDEIIDGAKRLGDFGKDFEDFFHTLGNRWFFGAYVGYSVGLVLVLLNIYFVVKAFKQILVNVYLERLMPMLTASHHKSLHGLNHGPTTDRLTGYRIGGSGFFVAFLVSACQLQTRITGLIIAIVLTIITITEFYTVVIATIWAWVFALVFTIIFSMVLTTVIGNNFLSDARRIKHPTGYLAFHTITTLFKLVIGSTLAILRLVYTVLSAFLVVMRVDKVLFPLPAFMAGRDAGHNYFMNVACMSSRILECTDDLKYTKAARRWNRAIEGVVVRIRANKGTWNAKKAGWKTEEQLAAAFSTKIGTTFGLASPKGPGKVKVAAPASDDAQSSLTTPTAQDGNIVKGEKV